MSLPAPNCPHTVLSFAPSPHAASAGYKQPTWRQRAAAAGLHKGEQYPSEATFPAPLVLPSDELSYGVDPDDDPQDLRSWLEEPERNEVTKGRKTIYVAAPPRIDPEVQRMRSWSQPVLGMASGKTSSTKASSLSVEGIISYLSAFYHGLPVKPLKRPPLHFTTWPKSPKSSRQLALATPAQATLIRHRANPNPSDPFSHQLNLSDLLDVCIDVLPSDAYALLLLVEQDIYEEVDDDFVCGRAYGGSRVAVVSTARYNPAIDDIMGVDREHAWPASHCSNYLTKLSTAAAASDTPAPPSPGSKKKTKSKPATKKAKAPPQTNTSGNNPSNPIDLSSPHPPNPPVTPMHLALQSSLPSPSSPSNLYLSRLAKTASHELGHCFGLDHCTYHACIMQATASLAEDARQPPYLCPVDLAKVLRAVGAVDGGVERYERLKGVCEEFAGDEEGGKGGMWGAFEGWLEGRVGEMEGREGGADG